MISLTDDESATLDTEGLPALRARLTNSFNQLAGRAKALKAKADAEGRNMTPAETSAFDRIVEQFDECDYKLRALDDHSLPLGNVSAAPRIVPPQPIRTNNGPHNFGVPMTTTYAPTGAKFENLFARPKTPAGGQFSSFGEFAMLALRDPLNPRLRNIQNESMQEATGGDGGFLVPQQFIQDLLDRSLAQEVIRPRASVFPMSSNSANAPGFDFTDATGNKQAGLVLRWIAELEQSSTQKAKIRNIAMRAQKCGIYCQASSELVEDAVLFSSRLESAMVSAITVGLDWVFLFGTGVGQPLGVLNSNATIVIAKESGQSADTIVEDNILKMAARLSPRSWANAVWMTSPTCLGQLYKLSQATGPSSGARTVALRETDSGLTLMTKPIVVTDACAPLGDKGDLLLCDWNYYLIGMRQDARLQTSIHDAWLTDEMSFRLLLRLAALPEFDAPLKLRDGTNTVSPFCVLAERA